MSTITNLPVAGGSGSGGSGISINKLNEALANALAGVATDADIEILLSRLTDDRVSAIDTINTNVATINANMATINTNAANLNSRLTDARATAIDTINTNAARLTSTRAGYIDYLANSTYGLSAIKTAIGNIGGLSACIKSVQNGFSSFSWSYGAQGQGYAATKTTDITISNVNRSKAFVVATFPFAAYAQPINCHAALISDTTLRITVQTATSTGSGLVGWQVIEFY